MAKENPQWMEGFNRNIPYKWSIFQSAMFSDRRVNPTNIPYYMSYSYYIYIGYKWYTLDQMIITLIFFIWTLLWSLFLPNQSEGPVSAGVLAVELKWIGLELSDGAEVWKQWLVSKPIHDAVYMFLIVYLYIYDISLCMCIYIYTYIYNYVHIYVRI